MTDRIGSLISLSRKAGKVQSGEFSVENDVRSGKAALVIISREASPNTKKKFRNMCSFYEVPEITYATKEELGRWIGCEYRAVLSISDEGFAERILDLHKAASV